jgi:ABC-type transport system involved in multi-copper enzyme maturation permease subunit
MITQTLALLLDAYRELNAKKMFWIVLVLSGIVVIAFAGTGINERGFTLFGIELTSPLFNTTIISRSMWYKYLFSNLGIGFWLTLCAMVLALISTASIFPDFIAGGSIDLYLSRPISRLRLFFTKYATGLLFVGLQVAVFATLCFGVIGIRGGTWEPTVFLPIPLVMLVFSFLFCVCVLLGLLTRSVIASLLLTLLFWMLIFGVDVAETGALSSMVAGQMEEHAYANLFSYRDREIELYKQKLVAGDATAQQRIADLERERAAMLEKKRQSDPGRHNWVVAHRLLFGAKTILPKTSETNSLIDRWLNITDEIGEERRQLREQRRNARGLFSSFSDRTEVKIDDPEVGRETRAILGERPVSWVLGTSIGFEALMLGVSAWIFCRRDY